MFSNILTFLTRTHENDTSLPKDGSFASPFEDGLDGESAVYPPESDIHMANVRVFLIYISITLLKPAIQLPQLSSRPPETPLNHTNRHTATNSGMSTSTVIPFSSGGTPAAPSGPILPLATQSTPSTAPIEAPFLDNKILSSKQRARQVIMRLTLRLFLWRLGISMRAL